ncbi:hypothetical protein J3458_006863 [Metarhizium acridum]|uniref:uncharacterized protein n=1 Tax=Metarhizium acridum TaxID=92637 RepID=UPI001C6B43AC|nr:hypothetical protein J3458_006863 [Metarhizium acridum]
MRLVEQKLPGVVVPRVYAYEGPGSQLAAGAGGVYMLLEGFYGNTLRDVGPDMSSLPLGRVPEADGGLVYQVVRLAFAWTGREADECLENIKIHYNASTLRKRARPKVMSVAGRAVSAAPVYGSGFILRLAL